MSCRLKKFTNPARCSSRLKNVGMGINSMKEVNDEQFAGSETFESVKKRELEVFEGVMMPDHHKNKDST